MPVLTCRATFDRKLGSKVRVQQQLRVRVLLPPLCADRDSVTMSRKTTTCGTMSTIQTTLTPR